MPLAALQYQTCTTLKDSTEIIPRYETMQTASQYQTIVNTDKHNEAKNGN